MMKSRWLYAVMIMLSCQLVSAEQIGRDPLQDLLINPEVVIHHGQELGLSDIKVEKLRRRLEQTGQQGQQIQQRINEAIGRLAKLLSGDEVDEEAAVKQLDEVLAIEKEQKHLHLRMLIQLRNELTPEQRQQAAKMSRTATSNEGLEQRLKAKLSQIERVVQQRSQAGQPPFEVVGLMQKFPELMQQGQVREAEALLDRVITMLSQGNVGRGGDVERGGGIRPPQLPAGLAQKIRRIQQGAQRMQQNGEDVSRIQNLMSQIGPLVQQGKVKDAEELVDQALELTNQKAPREADSDDRSESDQSEPTGPPQELGVHQRYSPAAVRAEVAALKKDDVAWRKIQWKTCLLDGLKASREQHKPIMLWIFIDRPVDDERC